MLCSDSNAHVSSVHDVMDLRGLTQQRWMSTIMAHHALRQIRSRHVMACIHPLLMGLRPVRQLVFCCRPRHRSKAILAPAAKPQECPGEHYSTTKLLKGSIQTAAGNRPGALSPGRCLCPLHPWKDRQGCPRSLNQGTSLASAAQFQGVAVELMRCRAC